jgi:orotidine-5'-phosphate decarboxylase
MLRMPGFADRLCAAIDEKDAPCVVGLDPVLELIPDEFVRACDLSRSGDLEERARLIEAYCAMTLEAVHDLVPAVKPQMAYFELFGSHGMRALESCIEMARSLGLQVLLDGKRGDIGSSSQAYADAYLARSPVRPYEVDCLTVSPYLGAEGLLPFVEVALGNEKGLFVLVRTSNPGAELLQEAQTGGRPLFELVADLVSQFNDRAIGASGFGSIGAVVGATQPAAAHKLRQQLPRALFLVPGFGAQGGSLETVRACFDASGRGAIVNSARAVMFPDRFGTTRHPATRDGIRAAALEFVEAVRAARP